jgi:hypothetical protein
MPKIELKKYKFYATLKHKISNRVIERAYENTPYPNSDGLIDYLESQMDNYDSICAINVDSLEEAETYFKVNYPTIWKEDKIQIDLRYLDKD